MDNLEKKCESCGAPMPNVPVSDTKNTVCFKCRMASFTKKLEPEKQPEPASTPKPASNIIMPTTTQAKTTSKELPERMKASRALAGSDCTICQKTIELGDDLYNCQACHASSMHAACYENMGACGNSGCVKKLVKKTPGLTPSNSSLDPQKSRENNNPDEDMIECTFCSEKIKRKASRCPYCRESLRPEALNKNGSGKIVYDEDSTLSTGEIIFSVLCGGLACIVGIVYVIQGKGKGWKMIGISFVSQIVFTVIRVAFGGL